MIMKGHIKKIFNTIIKYPITIWMITSVALLSAMYITYAAYNGTADVKRVVSTQATSRTVFSSNYMEIFSSSNLAVKNLRTTNEGNFICSVTVCNYDQLDPTTPARGVINYSLKAELVRFDAINNEYVPVTEVQMNGNTPKLFYVQKTVDENIPVSSDTNPTHDINTTVGNFSYTYTSESLTGGTSYKDSYDICFDAAEVAQDVPTLFIKVTATPTPESVQLNRGISTLSSVISISQGRSVETGWHGSLQETGSEDYDGYNLIIEGSGAGTIDILWDNTKFAMNPAFVTLYGGENGILTAESNVDDREGWKKRTLTVNSMEDNRYVVQFYKRVTSATAAGNIICNNYVATVVEEEPQP